MFVLIISCLLFPLEVDGEFGSFEYLLALWTLSLTGFAAVVSWFLAILGREIKFFILFF